MATRKDAVPMDDDKAIIIKTDAQLGTIDDNFEELKVAVAKKVMKYQGLVFADEDIKEAKATKAELKKMIDTIEDNRKAIKRKWNDPYTEFEKKVKEVIALIEKPMLNIDSQIRDFEERRKAEKETAVRDAMEYQLSGIIGDNQEFIRMAGISWDDRWLNATMSMTQVGADISTQISNMLRDINSIQDICEGDPMLNDLLIEYQNTKNLALTLQKRKAIVAQRENVRKMNEAAEARKKEQEEAEADRQRMLAQQAQARKEQEEAPLVINAADTPVIEDLVYSDEEEEELEIPTAPQPARSSLFSVTFCVEAGMEDMGKLIAYMNSLGITYRRLSQEKIA